MAPGARRDGFLGARFFHQKFGSEIRALEFKGVEVVSDMTNAHIEAHMGTKLSAEHGELVLERVVFECGICKARFLTPIMKLSNLQEFVATHMVTHQAETDVIFARANGLVDWCKEELGKWEDTDVLWRRGWASAIRGVLQIMRDGEFPR